MLMSRATFKYIVWSVALVAGITAFALIAAFATKYSGGLEQKHNLHAFLMVFGLLFLNGEALTIYRMIPNKKPATKYTHGAIQCVVFMIAVAGVNAVFQVVGDQPMYNLHAWVGIGALFLFTVQLVCGFIIFTVPNIPEKFKAFYLRIHVVFGIGILLLTTVAAVLGMNMLAVGLANFTGGFSEPVLMLNFAGVCSLIFTGCVVYIVSEGSFKAIPESP